MAASKKLQKMKPAQKRKAQERKELMNAFVALGYPCPIVDSCCYLPLKIGAYTIAILGILPTIACVLLATPVGLNILYEYGLPRWYGRGIKWAYAFLGILVFSAHVLLAVALKLKSRKCIILYLWALLIYMAGSFGIAVVISAKVILAGNTWFGTVFLLLATAYKLMLLYFWIVVHSQLHLQKAKSKVINIHITIV